MSDAMTAETVSAVLSRVIDPEVGINIVDLGLIYGVLVSRWERNAGTHDHDHVGLSDELAYLP